MESYNYLGVLLDEFLDSNKTAKLLADSAGRALGSLINKVKKLRTCTMCVLFQSMTIAQEFGGLKIY